MGCPLLVPVIRVFTPVELHDSNNESSAVHSPSNWPRCFRPIDYVPADTRMHSTMRHIRIVRPEQTEELDRLSYQYSQLQLSAFATHDLLH